MNEESNSSGKGHQLYATSDNPEQEGTKKAKSRSPEIKASCMRFPLETFNSEIIYLEEKVPALERFR